MIRIAAVLVKIRVEHLENKRRTDYSSSSLFGEPEKIGEGAVVAYFE
jgi:hypothetical protein